MMRVCALAVSLFTLLSAAPALASDWVVDPAQSHLTFTGTSQGQSFEGSFGTFTAKIMFDPAALESALVDVSIPVESISTGAPMRDDELPKPEWFDVKTFPLAHFTANKFTASAEHPGDYVADGTLTIRDVSQPLALPFTLVIEGNTAHMTSSSTLDRTVFGVGQGEWATGETVAKDVTVKVDLIATRAP